MPFVQSDECSLAVKMTHCSNIQNVCKSATSIIDAFTLWVFTTYSSPIRCYMIPIQLFPRSRTSLLFQSRWSV